MTDKPFIIDTKDERCKYLCDNLQRKGYTVVDKAEINKKYCYVYSPKHLVDVDDAEKITTGSTLVYGRITKDAKVLLMSKNISFHNIMADEYFTVKNTVPTALGCIQRLMELSNTCINELRMLVLGYGRVGKTLVKYLKGLDVPVFVYSVCEREKALASLFADGVADLESLGDFDVIINTIPARMIGEDNTIAKGSIVIDLASGNYVDIDGLNKSGITAVKAEGLPGIVAPKSAGGYMEEYILSVLEEDMKGDEVK